MNDLNERLDRIAEKADLLPYTSVSWEPRPYGVVSACVTVWCKAEGDVENKLADLIRRVADEMEVTRL